METVFNADTGTLSQEPTMECSSPLTSTAQEARLFHSCPWGLWSHGGSLAQSKVCLDRPSYSCPQQAGSYACSTHATNRQSCPWRHHLSSRNWHLLCWGHAKSRHAKPKANAKTTHTVFLIKFQTHQQAECCFTSELHAIWKPCDYGAARNAFWETSTTQMQGKERKASIRCVC